MSSASSLSATAAATASTATPPDLNPWGINQQLRDDFTAKNQEDFEALKQVLGDDIAQHLTRLPDEEDSDGKLMSKLTEIVMDCGRFAQAR